MAVKQVKNVISIPSAELEDWGPVGLPISDTVSQLRGRVINEHADGSEAGIWESTPGTWTRQVMDAEIATFLSGHARFHPDGGDTIDITAGDTVYFDENSLGTWEILDTTRKTYLTFKRGQPRLFLVKKVPVTFAMFRASDSPDAGDAINVAGTAAPASGRFRKPPFENRALAEEGVTVQLTRLKQCDKATDAGGVGTDITAADA